jgi:hypothetical protein
VELYVVSNTSGGLGSWAASKLAAQTYGPDNLTLLFADTLVESNDCYRFLIEGTANVFGMEPPSLLVDRVRNLVPVKREFMAERKDALRAIRREAMDYFYRERPGRDHQRRRLVWLADGRTPWEVFRDERFLGNSRVDPCSKILKRQLIDCWMERNCERPTPGGVVGLGWWESHRFHGDGKKKKGIRNRLAALGWELVAPLIDHRPILDRHDLRAWAEREGLELSRAYDEGFDHDNCSGMCVKAGQAHWRRMYHQRPEQFAFARQEEAELREMLGDVSMMSEERAGKKFPLPLTTFAERLEAGETCNLFGGSPCGCFTGEDEEVAA